jgi:hypothetical protein
LNDSIIVIEITDYNSAREEIHENYDTLKSKLILSTVDKAQRLGARVVIIAKGFPPNIFAQMKELAVSRKVTLLSDEEYKKGIEDTILQTTINSLRSRMRPRRGLPRGYLRVRGEPSRLYV